MHSHGVRNYPVPRETTTPGGAVAVTIAGPATAGAAPAFQAAEKACSRILPPPSSSGPTGPSKQEFLAFAHCLHIHGIPDFPDPNAQGQITGQMIAASGVNLKAPAFFTAAKACVSVTHGAMTIAGVARFINGSH
jgi:hypothetical protein